jgi:hypothetical protein
VALGKRGSWRFRCAWSFDGLAMEAARVKTAPPRFQLDHELEEDMKRIVVLIGLILCLSSLGFSQQGGRFYSYFSPSGQVRVSDGNATYFGFGAAGMYLGSKGYGGGAEISAVGPMEHKSNQDNWNKRVVGLFTLNGIKVFKLSNEKAEPFLTSGYGRSFMRGAGENFWEIGGGINYWFNPKLGLTFEFRDYIHRQDKNDWWQFIAPRIGITWRD